MKAAVFHKGKELLELCEVARPEPKEHELLLQVNACAICRTDLHVIDGDLANPKENLILGHEIVGTVIATGKAVTNFKSGDLVGVPWLASTCLSCSFCLKGHENLCPDALFTGYSVDGGFSEYTVADARFCFSIPANYDAAHAAPLLCAGLIGWRALKFAGDEEKIGIYGFGAAAHVITPIALHQGKRIFAFTSPGDERRQKFALTLGADWSGSSLDKPPEPLDAAIIFASAGSLVPKALSDTRAGGTVVCGGIHMSDIPSFPYSQLWGERIIKSVANLCRSDGEEFFNFVRNITIETHVSVFALDNINQAIRDLRQGSIEGAAVIVFKT
jgi:propanol-preferring alcohol dehydrogenase